MMVMSNNVVSMSTRKLIGRFDWWDSKASGRVVGAAFTRIREFRTTTTTARNQHHEQYYYPFTQPNRHGSLLGERAIREFSASVRTTLEDEDGPLRQYQDDEEENVGIEKYYRIEASNAERQDATKLTVHGPDVDGILASMTFALAVDKGCSLLELYASSTASARNKDSNIAAVTASATNDNSSDDDDPQDWIHDVFWVVDRDTGRQIPDAELQDLALCLLEAAHSPMSKTTGMDDIDKKKHQQQLQAPIPEKQITIIPSISSPHL